MESTSKLSFLEKVGVGVFAMPFFAIIIVLAVLYGAFAGGYVSMTLYEWFIIPHFKGLPLFSYWHFAGFSMFFLAILPSGKKDSQIKDKYKEDNALLKSIIGVLLKPWMLLFAAWILKLSAEYFA